METYSRIRSIKLKRPTPEHPFGFSVRGGHEHGTGVFVSSVVPKTIAHRQGLRVGDQILRVNGYPVSAAVHQECLSLMKNRTNLHLKVRSVGMLPVREKTGEPLTWKLVEDPIGETALILEVPVVTRHHPQTHRHHSHGHHHNHHHNGHHHAHKHAGQRMSDASSQSESRGGSAGGSGGGSELFHGMEGKVYINTSGESGLGCCICKGPPERPGIFVQSTKSNGVAREAGLRPGDQILFCNGHSFHNIAFAEAVHYLKASKHLNLSVLKGAASDLFPGESSGYNSSASSLNGEVHNMSMSGGSHLTTTASSGSSGGDENSIHSEVVVEQHEPPKRLSVVNEEQHQQSHSKDEASLMKQSRRNNALALDRNMEWDEVEQVWHSAEKESLIIEIKGETDPSGAKVGHPLKKEQQQIQTQQEIARLADERRKLEQEQKRLQEEANRLEQEKRKFEEEKRQAALMIMNETTNMNQRDSSSTVSNHNTSAVGSVTSRGSTSSGKSTHSLHGALTQEILKRNERRENGSNLQNADNGTKSDANSEQNALPLSDLPPAGTVDQKKSLFTAVPIIDDEKRLQHEQLIEEFKRAHRKMFAHALDDATNLGTNGNSVPSGTGSVESQQELNNEASQQTTSSSTSSTASTNGHFQRGTEPERESFRAKRIQKEVEHAKKMIEQRLVGVAKQRLLRIERQHQECRETEREVSKHVVTNHKKKSPPPPPPLPTLVEDCSIDQIEQAPEVIVNGQYNNNYIKTAVETRHTRSANGLPNKAESSQVARNERPASPSPDYSNSPSPTPESEMQTREIEIIPDKIVQMTSYPSAYSKQNSTRADSRQQIEHNRNGGYHHQQNFGNCMSATNGVTSQDEIINGLSRCQLSQRLQNEIKMNGNNGVTIVVSGGASNSCSTKYTNNKYPGAHVSHRPSPGILKPTSRTGLKVTPPTAPPHHLKRYENNNSNNNNDMKAISFGKF